MNAPLVRADCDLRDFPFMPLDVVRLRDSDLAALESPEACWAAVLLWCASWHQIPAASIPDDDRVLAKLAGFGKIVKEWAKIKDGALRGWVKCSDGRLYHPVIAEKANEAFKRKLEQGWRTECARIKKSNQRHETNNPVPTLEEYLSQKTTGKCPEGQPKNVPVDSAECPRDVPEETPSNRQGYGQGQGNIKPTSQSINAGEPEKFVMFADWKPSPHVETQAKQSGTPLLAGDLPEFVSHWLTQPLTRRTQAEWDKSLLQSAKHRKLRASSPVPPKGKPATENFGSRDYGQGVTPL